MAVVVLAIVVLAVVWLQGLLYAKLWNKKLKAGISISEKAAFEGAELILTEELVNAKFLPLPWVAMKFQVSKTLVFADDTNYQISDDYYRNDLFSILMFQKIIRRRPFVCSRRGYYRVKSIDLVSSNLLMGEKLACSMSSDAAVTVYPRLIDIDEKTIPYKNLHGNLLTRRFINPDPFTFKGIREYQPYDSFKSINFSATAKAGKYMVNINDFTLSQEIVILLNLQPYNVWSSQALHEHSIRLAASLSDYYIGESVPISLVSNGRDIMTGRTIDIDSGSGAGHLTNIYEALARIDLDATASSTSHMSSILYDKIRSLETGSVYILISTYHEKDLREVWNELAEIGADALWIIPCAADLDIDIEMSKTVVKWEVDNTILSTNAGF